MSLLSDKDIWKDCRHRSRMLWAAEVETDYFGSIISEVETEPSYACIYGESYPDKFIDMPRWITSEVFAGGPGFQPGKHCQNCPAYERATIDNPSHDSEIKVDTGHPPKDLSDLFNL